MIANVTTEWSEIIRRASPAYTEAYQEGYEQAKREMAEMLTSMKALHESTTVSFTVDPKKQEERL